MRQGAAAVLVAMLVSLVGVGCSGQITPIPIPFGSAAEAPQFLDEGNGVDADCDEGQSCLGGRCVTTCGGSDGCDQGQECICFEEDCQGFCAALCDNDADCTGADACQGGHCIYVGWTEVPDDAECG